METSEKVVKRLNDKNYLYVPRTILKEADKIDLEESEPETGIDSNEEIGSGFRLNRKAIVQPAPSPVTFLTVITEEITDPQKLLETTESIKQNIPETTLPPSDDTTEADTASQGVSTTVTDKQAFWNGDSATTIELVSKYGPTDNDIGLTTEQDTETTEEVTEMTVEDNEKTKEVTETTEDNTETTKRDNETSTKKSGESTELLEEDTTAETLAKESTEFITESQTELSPQSQESSESGNTQNKSRVVKRVRRKKKSLVKTTHVKTKRESSSDEETKRDDASSIQDDSNEHETTSSTNIDNDSNENVIKAEDNSDDLEDEFIQDGDYKFVGDGYDYNEGKYWILGMFGASYFSFLRR